MIRVVMTKEEVLATINECAAQIGHVPSFPELTKLTKVRRRAIFTHFGTYTEALRACGLERSGPQEGGRASSAGAEASARFQGRHVDRQATIRA